MRQVWGEVVAMTGREAFQHGARFNVSVLLLWILMEFRPVPMPLRSRLHHKLAWPELVPCQSYPSSYPSHPGEKTMITWTLAKVFLMLGRLREFFSTCLRGLVGIAVLSLSLTDCRWWFDSLLVRKYKNRGSSCGSGSSHNEEAV